MQVSSTGGGSVATSQVHANRASQEAVEKKSEEAQESAAQEAREQAKSNRGGAAAGMGDQVDVSG